MQQQKLPLFVVLATCSTALLAGCQDSGTDSTAVNSGVAAGSLSLSPDEHNHSGHEGKHGGTVIELDDSHGHHAELVFDPVTRDITLYFYGSEIGVAKPATGLEFELEKDGQESVVESTASPLDGETEETCSRFVIAGKALPESVTKVEDLEGHFHIVIDGREYVADLPGHHDHDHGAEHGAGTPASEGGAAKAE